ncbi:MAG: SAF domain-containing protein, partial [Kiritimatiellia bacterium]
LEVHVTFSRDCFGPDVPASLTVPELRELVRGVRMMDLALANPVDKDAQADSLATLRKTFGKKVVTAKALKAGHEILLTDLAYKKSDSGVSASEAALFVGKRLIRDLSADVALEEGDVA